MFPLHGDEYIIISGDVARIVKRQLPVHTTILTVTSHGRYIYFYLYARVSVRRVRIKACLRVCLRWLAYEQQKVSRLSSSPRQWYEASQQSTERILQWIAQCCTRFIIYRLGTTPLPPSSEHTSEEGLSRSHYAISRARDLCERETIPAERISLRSCRSFKFFRPFASWCKF